MDRMDKMQIIRINVIKKCHPFNKIDLYCYALDIRCLRSRKFKKGVYFIP